MMCWRAPDVWKPLGRLVPSERNFKQGLLGDVLGVRLPKARVQVPHSLKQKGHPMGDPFVLVEAAGVESKR